MIGFFRMVHGLFHGFCRLVLWISHDCPYVYDIRTVTVLTHVPSLEPGYEGGKMINMTGTWPLT